MIKLESARFYIREIEADNLPNVLAVYTSNADFLKQVEGSEGEAGRYDLARWQRDWAVAQMMPRRHMLACYLKEQGEAVGITEYLEENEDDGKPWLGALTIHKAYQRRGLGSEIFYCLLDYFRQHYGWSVLRAGVLAQNQPGLAFAQHVGFRPVKQYQRQLAAGVQEIVLLERSLAEA